jgi:hypothetical protein
MFTPTKRELLRDGTSDIPGNGVRFGSGAVLTRIRRALEAFDAKTRQSIGAAVAASLQKFTDSDGLGLPMAANILVASR